MYLAVKAQQALTQVGIDVSIISMPAWHRFEAQSTEYKELVLPKVGTKRLASEIGASALGKEVI